MLGAILMSQIVQFFRYCIFHVYHHNSFVFDQNLKIKKTKFAEISALSFTFWSKSPSSFSLVAGTIQRRLHWPYRFFGCFFFCILHHNSFIFYPISNIKKAKFAEISALSFTNWSKSASSFSLESRTNRRRQGAAVKFCPYFSGQFPAKI